MNMYKMGICVIGLTFLLGCAEKRAPVPMAKTETKPILTTNAVVQIAREAVAKNDTWADHATYEASHGTNGWSVMVWRIEGYDTNGKPQFVPGGHRFVQMDEAGKVTSYFRGH